MMDTQKINVDFLGDLYKIAKNTIAIFDRLTHITDEIALGIVLTDSAKEYKAATDEIELILSDYGKKPKVIGEIERTANNFANGIQTGWHTLFDKSTSRVAELVMENMLDNIVTGYRVHKKNMFERKVMDINKTILALHEKTFEQMKKFL